MQRAIILGGTGALGRATARRLVAAGWSVDITGRQESHLPGDLRQSGARFHPIDRHDTGALAALLGDGADLLVDALCFTQANARELIPLLGDVASTVMLSSKAVYADEHGNHVNSDVAPRFTGPIRENQRTMAAGHGDHDSREGYGANKVAAEQALLNSGCPVTVIRASKVHGDGAARPREWMFIKRALEQRPAVFLAHGGAGIDHTTAAVNTAALIARVAEVPGTRILNSADPDAPSALQITRAIAAHFNQFEYYNHAWEEILLDDSVQTSADPDLGQHPWDARPPIILDTTASIELGYTPVGTFAETIAGEINWLLFLDRVGFAPGAEDPFFGPLLDYAAEDRYLAARASDRQANGRQ
ncbi:NAD-dependent epimerase/dehydratase family protein [Cryobacterium frigoriphilum]|uniref:NAD-dependent epimerase/dehydratase family protein n=1 Tax=Cryobacterium frigoriphilum TaxID=1259150 RepID=A0A4R8ZVC4_9MICO|nr:NAD-dependent epimerase/dehydratase family protein [Cryobacterium frigoriphilum]TFD46992.1 NAD-dependent epimerase/dehydratase family protein [Cryobacterium frigoriphilum]